MACFSKPGEGKRHRSTPRIEACNAHRPPDHDACIAPSATRTHSPSAIGGVVTTAKAGKIVEESVDEILDALFQEMTGSPVGPSGVKPRKTPAGVARIYWTKTKNLESYKIYQRDDLIDLTRVDKKGRTNLELMKRGRSRL